MRSLNKSEISILAIIGPTAVGKTQLSIDIARAIKGEIIGLDSRQIYSGMEVGTAAPTEEEQKKIKHHLVGIKRPNATVSAGEYAKLVDGVVEDIIQRNREIILCGGAGLYYRALTKGIFDGSTGDLSIRERLNNEYDALGQDKLLARLTELDSEYAKLVHPNNKKRLVRALEIFELTGSTPTEHFEKQKSNPVISYRIFTVLLIRDMTDLENRIEKRVEKMIATGWVGEVEQLRSEFELEEMPSINSIGYQQIIDHLNGKITYDEMMSEIILKTRQYAKRQIAWFKHENTNLTYNLSNNLDYNSIKMEIVEKYKMFQYPKRP